MRIQSGWMVVAIGLAVSGCSEAGQAPTGESVEELRVVTFNVLVDIQEGGSVTPWEERKSTIVALVKDARPDIIGFQETSPNQLAYLREQLPEFADVGEVPLTEEHMAWFRENFPPVLLLGLKAYTDTMLMYRADAFEKIDEGYWWLSPTPDTISVGFGNSFPRMMVWAKLRHKDTGKEFVAFNTHFDNSEPAQENMAKLAHDKMQPFLDEGLPAIFTGDFNTDQKRGDYPLLTSGGWRDSYLVCPEASEDGRDDNVGTTLGGKIRIDHIFYHGDWLEAREWRKLTSPDPAITLSDHFPVLAVFDLK